MTAHGLHVTVGSSKYETPGFARALVCAAKIRPPLRSSLHSFLVDKGVLEETVEDCPAPGLVLEQFGVDYGALDAFGDKDRRKTIFYNGPQSISLNADAFEGRMVLIGDVREAKDVLVAYGYRTAPGVFLHGCAIGALRKSRSTSWTRRVERSSMSRL